MTAPTLVIVAGIDPTGGAGLALDLRVAARQPVRVAALPSCLTEQNRSGFVRAEAIASSWLLAMLDAVAAEGPIEAVKIGLCVEEATVVALADWLGGRRSKRPWLVVDPVLSATAGGGPLHQDRIARAIVARLVPLGAVLTPNHAELEALAAEREAAGLLHRGAQAVLLKDGHGGGDRVEDRLITATGEVRLAHPRLRRGPVHGTGCALATGLAARLACGASLELACRDAIADVARWIAATPDTGDGRPDPIAVS